MATIGTRPVVLFLGLLGLVCACSTPSAAGFRSPESLVRNVYAYYGDRTSALSSGLPHDAETIGRLQVRGPTLFNGYLNRPDATAEAFDADGWYRTGDAAVIDGDGMHRIVGRESVDLIKSGGYRVGAGEIETVLLGHPGVAEVAVVGLPDEDLGQRIVAFIVGDADPQELIDYVAQQLSAHKRPREVRIVEKLPRNAMGKVLKKQLLTES